MMMADRINDNLREVEFNLLLLIRNFGLLLNPNLGQETMFVNNFLFNCHMIV